jgi:hypothetical protein
MPRPDDAVRLWFERIGADTKRLDEGLTVRHTKDESHAFSLAAPVLHSGNSSVTLRLNGSYPSLVVGVFVSDMRLDGSIDSAVGKRCALRLRPIGGGWGRVLCDGVRSEEVKGIGLKAGDTVKVTVKFENRATALVRLRCKGLTWNEKLHNVPKCGLRFGVGELWEGDGATIVASSIDADWKPPLLWFERVGASAKRLDGGLTVSHTKDEAHAFSLIAPVLHSGKASVTLRLNGPHPSLALGVFVSDMRLDGSIDAADGKRCALRLLARPLRWQTLRPVDGGWARVLCNDARSEEVNGLALATGDTVEVSVKFEDAATAHVTLRCKDLAYDETLRGVPKCGLRFGVGDFWEGDGATIVAGSVDPKWVRAMPTNPFPARDDTHV